MQIGYELSNNTGPIIRYYVRETGKALVAAVDSSNDVIYADLDDNGRPVSAQNRVPLEDSNKKLKDENMVRDNNTLGFTMFGGKIGSQEKPDHLEEYRT